MPVAKEQVRIGVVAPGDTEEEHAGMEIVVTVVVREQRIIIAELDHVRWKGDTVLRDIDRNQLASEAEKQVGNRLRRVGVWS